MSNKEEGRIVSMGASCKTFSAVRKQKEQEMQKPLTIDEQLKNVAENTSNALNEHGNVLNAIAYYIENTDTKVAKAGGLLKWVQKDIAKRQRLAERKAEYKAKKDA